MNKLINKLKEAKISGAMQHRQDFWNKGYEPFVIDTPVDWVILGTLESPPTFQFAGTIEDLIATIGMLESDYIDPSDKKTVAAAHKALKSGDAATKKFFDSRDMKAIKMPHPGFSGVVATHEDDRGITDIRFFENYEEMTEFLDLGIQPGKGAFQPPSKEDDAQRRVGEAGVIVAEPEVQPATTPSTEPKRQSPLKPSPGITPKPKASRDLKLFVQARESVSEQHIAHPDKVKWILQGDPTLNKMLPELSTKEESYLMQIASDEYTDLVTKVEKYTGMKVEKSSIPALYQLLMQSVEKAKEIEQKHKKYFEEWAVMLPLELDEFKMVEEAVTAGDLKIDAKLEEPDLSKHLSDEPEKGELSPAEDLNLAMMKELEDSSETAIQRRFANLLTAGGSSHKLYLFNMMKEKLDGIDPKLVNMYGILASLAQLGYWVTPDGIEKGAASSEEGKGGSEELVPDGDNYIIKARAVTFPYLVHEVVKGIYEWLSLHKEHEPEMKGETLGQETKDMLAGPGVFKKFMSYIPADKQYLSPLVQRYATKLSPKDIRSVLDNSGSGKMVMGKLVKQAAEDWYEYKRATA